MGRIRTGDILAGAFSLYFKSVVLFTGIAILVFIPSIALRILATGKIPDLVFSGLDFVLTQIVLAAIISGVFRQLKKKRVELGRCLSVAFSRLFPLLGVVILTLILCALPLLPGGIVTLISPVLGSLLVTVGTVFFMMIYVALIAATPVVVVERIGVRAALSRSVTLTRGNRWPIFWVYFVLGCLSALANIIWTFITVPTWAIEGTQPPLVYSLGVLVTSIVFGALNAVAVALIYYQLKIKVDGIDEDELASVFD
jgi:hypothetical protein